MRYVEMLDGSIGLYYKKAGTQCFLKLYDPDAGANPHINLSVNVKESPLRNVGDSMLRHVLREDSTLMRDGWRFRDAVRAVLKAVDSIIYEKFDMTGEFLVDRLLQLIGRTE